MPAPETRAARAPLRAGRAARRRPAARAARAACPSLEPRPSAAGGRGRASRAAAGVARRRRRRRRAGACSRSQRIGMDNDRRHAAALQPAWVLVGLALMCLSMVMRAVAWHAILRAALPAARVRLARRAAGHVDRRADVGDAARPPGRALARADRRAPARAPARGAARPCSARSSRRRCSTSSRWSMLGVVMFSSVDIFHGHQRRAGRLRDRAGGDPRRGAASRPALLRARRAVALAPRCTRGVRSRARALAQVRAGLRVFRQPAPRRVGRRRAARGLGDPVAVLLRAARRARPRRSRRHRRRRGGALRGQRHRRAAGDAVEPRRLPGRMRRGAHRRLRRLAPPTRSATGSSCRPSRSRPRS